jgi:hypothetical protein
LLIRLPFAFRFILTDFHSADIVFAEVLLKVAKSFHVLFVFAEVLLKVAKNCRVELASLIVGPKFITLYQALMLLSILFTLAHVNNIEIEMKTNCWLILHVT